jgi:hypothetical protein
MWFDATNFWVKMLLTLAICRQLIALKDLWKVFENRQQKCLKVFFWSWRLRTLVNVIGSLSSCYKIVTHNLLTSCWIAGRQQVVGTTCNNKSDESTTLQTSGQQAVDNLSTSWEQAIYKHILITSYWSSITTVSCRFVTVVRCYVRMWVQGLQIHKDEGPPPENLHFCQLSLDSALAWCWLCEKENIYCSIMTNCVKHCRKWRICILFPAWIVHCRPMHRRAGYEIEQERNIKQIGRLER